MGRKFCAEKERGERARKKRRRRRKVMAKRRKDRKKGKETEYRRVESDMRRKTDGQEEIEILSSQIKLLHLKTSINFGIVLLLNK